MVNYDQMLSDRVKVVKPSGIRRFFEMAAKMPHAISLGVGEPDFETPWQIRRAGIQSLEKGQTFYTSNWGLAELRSQIAALARRKYQLCYDADKEILVTVGGSEATTIPSAPSSIPAKRCSFPSRALSATRRSRRWPAAFPCRFRPASRTASS